MFRLISLRGRVVSIAMLLLLLIGSAAQSVAAGATPALSGLATASSAAVAVTSSPTELRIHWSSSMIGGNANDATNYSSTDARLATSLAGMTPVPGVGGPGLSADGTLVTFRYSRPLVPGTYTLQIAEVQDGDGNLVPPATASLSLATTPQLFALIAEPNNPFPPAPGTRPIAEGWQVVITDNEARFASAPTGDVWIDNGVRIAVLGSGDWALDLVAPRGQSLTPGLYPNATWRFHGTPDQPEIDISGVGTGCSSVGSFEIRDIAFIDDPLFGRKPIRLDASFEARCTTFSSRLFGLVRYSQDTTPPVITANVTPLPNADGWNNSPVTVTWTVSDPESGIRSSFCFTTNVTTETGFYYVPCSATNGAGLRSDAFVVVKIDLTLPTITASRTPLANSFGWNGAPVVVAFTCTDPISIWGFASGLASCSTGATFGEGAGQSITGQAVDRAGNVVSATVGGLNIDMTAPTMTFTGNGGTYTVDQTILVTCSASDTLSGVATTSCPAVASGPATDYVGTTATTSTTLTATATDRAGNPASASTTFTVTVTADGICRLSASLAEADDICAKVTSIATASTAAAKAGKLQAFDNFLAAQNGKSIPANVANLLGRLAHLL